MRAKLKLDHQTPSVLPRTLRPKGALWLLTDRESQPQDWLLIFIESVHEICFSETRRRILLSFSHIDAFKKVIIGHCSTFRTHSIWIARFLKMVGGRIARACYCPTCLGIRASMHTLLPDCVGDPRFLR